jgi:SAM-dependent methyltransferase
MSGEGAQFWDDYYRSVHQQPQGWLDYSNEPVQVQGFALALEAAGAISGRSALDAGCGKGQFTRLLRDLGASPAIGMDLIEATILSLRQREPSITWLAGDVSQSAQVALCPACDIVFALEVLQYVPFAPALEQLWRLVRPGGRLIGLIPNRDCPIVAKPMARFKDRYLAVSSSDITDCLSGLPGLGSWRMRGLRFADDQRIAPYQASPWVGATAWESPPNRFQFVAIRPGT